LVVGHGELQNTITGTGNNMNVDAKPENAYKDTASKF